MYTLAMLNGMSQAAFTEALGSIFEHTPAIAQTAWLHRPFTSVDDLHQKMVAVVVSLSVPAQLQLVRAHPDLGSKARMAEASIQEQASVGLDQLSPAEYDRFQTLNQAYKDKFGFPFIIAVKNQTKVTILQAFEQRLTHTTETELQRAIAEIAQIARFRLLDCITDDA